MNKITTISEFLSQYKQLKPIGSYVPTAEALKQLLKNHGFTKINGFYYDRRSVWDCVNQHIQELIKIDKDLATQAKEKEVQKRTYKPYVPKYGHNLSPESVELLKKDDVWYESVIRKAILESLDELKLYHGSTADFDEFNLAFLGSGWGQQAYGYGVYLSNSRDAAHDYAKGGKIYTVEVPNGKYLSYEGIPPKEAMRIAKLFFKYYTTEDEYGKEAYPGEAANEFWEMECKYIADCSDGGSVYGTVASLIGSDKEASEFFSRIGYVGIEWIATNGETGVEFANYVIFDPKNIKILRKE